MKKLLWLLFCCGIAHASEVPYLSGGIGLESREEMRALAPSYNLYLIFTQARGEYLADIDIEIKSEDGRAVLRAVSDGPWLYARLEPGTYVVIADQNGSTLTKRVVVDPAKPSTVYFRWS
jgi:hypothetical protein